MFGHFPRCYLSFDYHRHERSERNSLLTRAILTKLYSEQFHLAWKAMIGSHLTAKSQKQIGLVCLCVRKMQL